eukprot:sb/3470050/
MSGQFPNSSHFPGFGTHAAHHGSDPDTWDFKPIVPPISLSTTFKQSAPGVPPKYDYSRAGNPTRTAFEECVAKLEGATEGFAASSGLAATMLIVNMLKSGDHILVCDDVYGGTNRYFNRVVANFGISVSMVDPIDLTKFEGAIQDNTALVWLETPTNPTLKIIDIAAVCEMVNRRFEGKKVTKYINGHTDVCMGVICTNDTELAEKLRFLQLGM